MPWSQFRLHDTRPASGNPLALDELAARTFPDNLLVLIGNSCNHSPKHNQEKQT